MRYQPLALGPMQQCGSSLRRALQNESTVVLDLLMRESVQNSLDAATEPTGEVRVRFDIRKLDAAAVGSLLEGHGIQERLVEKCPGVQHALEIRDENTRGLNGPSSLEGVGRDGARGNLVKLVYEVGRAQSAEMAGGSWGLGKTVYFRIGIGLVFYYSRFRGGDGSYVERLAGCLVEDEASPTRLQRESATGIAWWGSGTLGPVEDPDEISLILDVLGIQRFSGTETGTSVTIPFLREDLLPSSGPGSEVDDGAPSFEQVGTPWWMSSYAAYLRVALQRWYCVRLGNRRFKGGAMLRAFVCGDELEPREMLPAFQVAQALYNRAIGNFSELDVLGRDGGALAVSVENVKINSVLRDGAVAGSVAMAKLSKVQLGMAVPDNNLSPFHAIGELDQEPPFRPIVGFLRSPGMIVRWEDRSDRQGWGGGEAGFSDAYVIAVFVPDASLLLTPETSAKLGMEKATLGAYLRRCEMADHRQWADVTGFTIVRRIREHVGRRIRAFCAPVIDPQPVALPLLAARTLADRLLPRGFGADGRGGMATAARATQADDVVGRFKGGAKPFFEVIGVRHTADLIHVDWKAGGDAMQLIQLMVDSEIRPIPRVDWVAEELGEFPLAIAGLNVSQVHSLDGLVPVERIEVGVKGDGASFFVGPGSSHDRGACIEGNVQIRIAKAQRGRIRPVLKSGSKDSGGDA